MADEYQELTKAFSGLGGHGVDEASLVSAMARWRKQPDKVSDFRKKFTSFFTSHHGIIEKAEDGYLQHLDAEFSRFRNITVLWAMHPWERDARWAYQVVTKAQPATVMIEIACTRSSDSLLGARRAYHAIFHRSLEEDVAYHLLNEIHCKLLVGLASAYRYEGPKVKEDVAKSEAKVLGNAIKASHGEPGKILENGEVVRILTTRSKPHLSETFKFYKELFGKSIQEDLVGDQGILRATAVCLTSPAEYFSQIIHDGFKAGASSAAKDAVSRVLVSRSDVDMDDIKEAYKALHGEKLEAVIVKNTHGHYKDALLSLAGN